MRRGTGMFAVLAVGFALVTMPGAASAETPTPTVWETPGVGAEDGKTVKISGRSESLQQRRQPLVLIDEKRAGKKRSLTLSADVLFAKDSAELNSAANDTLEEVAKRIEASEAKGPVEIVGHTDTDGTSAHNQDLSTRRAKSVADALEPRLGSTDTTLKPVGRGERDLAVSPERSAADKAKNRRVTVTYTTTKSEPAEERSEYDISVPDTQEAKPAKTQKVEGSRAAYERTLVDDEGGKSVVKLDLMAFEKQGPFVYARVRLTAVSLPAGTDSFTDVEALFSGDTTVTNDAQNTVLYDEPGGTKLRYYVTGKGEPMRSSIPSSLEEGQTADVWFLYTAPAQDREYLDMYVPAFGVLKALEVKS